MESGRAQCLSPGVDVTSLSSQGRLECLENKAARTPWEVSWNCFSHVVPTLLVALLHIFEDCVSPVSLR